MYIHKETLEIVDIAGLKQAYPDTSFPVPVTAEALEGFDYLVIDYAEAPEIPDGYELRDGEVSIIEGRAIRQWDLVQIPVVAPEKVTMRQARLALHAAGLLPQVQPAIDSLSEPDRTAAQIEWDYSSEVFRNREFVNMLGSQLGVTSEQIDQLFIQADTL